MPPVSVFWRPVTGRRPRTFWLTSVIMQDFQLYIDDDRHTILSLCFLALSSAERAREFAEMTFANSPHHRGAELRQGDAHIWSEGSLLHGGRAPLPSRAAVGSRN